MAGKAAAGRGRRWAILRHVTLNLEAGEADVTTRANAGWRATVATLKEASVEFEMVWDTADAGFTAIKNAFFGNDPIGFQILDETAGQGLQADFSITNFSRNECAGRGHHGLRHGEGHLFGHGTIVDRRLSGGTHAVIQGQRGQAVVG